MICLYSSGQLPLQQASVPLCPLEQTSRRSYATPCLDRFESTKQPDPRSHREWPWRILPFLSDLGTVGYLLNRPQLGLVGWLIAIPYYLYAIGRQPDTRKRKEEVVYQATTNGLLPFIEAKLGVIAGEKLHVQVQKLTSIARIARLSPPFYKLLGALIALATLTPTVGDPMSQWICKQYQTASQKDDKSTGSDAQSGESF